MALYDNVDSSIKQRKQKLNNNHIRNLKIMNILNALVMAFLIVIDIFLLVKGIFTGMPMAVTVLLIIFVVAQIGSLVIFSIKRFARASMVTKVGIMIICFLPIIPYFMYLSIGNNIYIACILSRLIGLAALAMLLFNTKVTNDKKTFGVKGVPLAIASGFAFLTILYILVSTTNRKIIYQYDKMYNGYVVNNVLAGAGKVKIKEDTVAISDGALKNVSGNLVIPKNVKYISEDAFKDSKITSLTIQSDNIELMNAVNNSNIENIYLETNECKIDVENLEKDIDIETNREVVDSYRETYRKYDYYFVPKLNEDEYYVCYNGTTLPVYIYKEEKTLTEPEKSSLPSNIDGRSILYDGYYVSNDEINFPLNVSSNTKIACKYSYVYNISYDFSGCEEESLPSSYYDKLGDINLPELEMEGYQFKGWYDVDQYGNYTQKYTKLDNTLNKDVNLKAKFLKEFTVTFDKVLADATFDSDDQIIFTEEDVFEIVNPTRDGFTFDGWYMDRDYKTIAPTYINSNTTLYAKWTINNTISLSDDISKTYDKQKSNVFVEAQTEISGVDISYKWYYADGTLKIEDSSFSVVNAKDSGEYYAIVTLNYNDIIINEIKSNIFNVNIEKASYDMSGVILENKEYDYDGTIHTPKLSGNLPIGIDGYQITYSFEGGIKNVGSDTVICNFNTISENYNVPESMSAVVTIVPRVVSVTWNYNQAFEYDGNPHFPEYSLYNVIPADASYIEGDKEGSYNAIGEHTAKIVGLLPVGTSSVYKNYVLTTDEENITIQYRIVPEVNYVDGIVVRGVSVVYDGEIHIPSVDNLPSNIDPIYTVIGQDNMPQDVGTYSVKVTFKYNDTNTKEISNEVIVNVTIMPREITLAWDFSGIEYDGQPHSPACEITNIIGSDDVSIVHHGTQAINAGTYTITDFTISGTKKDNYKLPSGYYYEYVITPKEIVIDLDNLGFEDNSYDYNGKNQYPVIQKSNLPEGVLVTYSGYGKDAGEYEVSAEFSINSNNFVVSDETSSKTITVIINPITAVIEWGQRSFIYDDQEHVPTARVVNLLNGDQCSVSVQGAKFNVGENYVATVVELSNSNYVLPEETISTTFNIESNPYSFEFTFDDITVEYDGLEHKPIVEINGDQPVWLEIEYSEGLTNVGTKTVTATFISNDSAYDVPSPVNATVTIVPREAEISFTMPSDNTYSGLAIYPTAHVSNAVGSDNPTVELDSYENNINAGLHTVYASQILDNDNYILTSRVAYSYEILKATYDTSNLRFVSATHEYDGYIHKPSIAAADSQATPTIIGLDGIAVTYKYSDGLKDVGTKTVTVTFIGSSNYNTIPQMASSITITAKEVSLQWVGDEFTYTGSILKPECILSGLVLNDTCDFTINAQGIDVGTYTATITNLTNPNYKLPQNSSHSYTITPATINLGGLAFNSRTMVYNKTLLAPEMVGTLPEGVEVEFEGLSSDVGVHNITINFIVGRNYNSIPSRSVDVEITPRPISIEWSNLEIPYSGNISYPTYTLSNIITGDVCDIVVVGGETNVGSHTATASNTTNDNYYIDANATVTYTIIPAEYDMTGIRFEDATVEYDGLEHKPTLSGQLPGGLSFALSSGATNVSDGTVTVTATFTSADENYNAPKPMKATIKILAKELNVSWSNLVFTYDGTKHTPTATLSGILAGDTCVATITDYGINADTYTCQISSLSNSNYQASSTVEYVINKASYDMSTISFVDTTFAYDGQEHYQVITGTLSNIVGLDGISPEVLDYVGSVTNVSQGEVECVVRFTTTSINYNIPADMTCMISVTPKTVDLTITLDTDSTKKASVQTWTNSYALNITYDGIEHSVTITPSGVVGNEEVEFEIDGTFKNYNGGQTYIFNITSDNSNYTSTYKLLYVTVNRISTGYNWSWNSLTANWWNNNNPSDLEDVVLIYRHVDFDIEYTDELPTIYGEYKLRYESTTENVVINTSSESTVNYKTDLTVDTLLGLIDYYDSNKDGIITDYDEFITIQKLYTELNTYDEKIEDIIYNSYVGIIERADIVKFSEKADHTATTTSTICTVIGNIKVNLASLDYYGERFDYAVKMESGKTVTNITLDLSGKDYMAMIIVLDTPNTRVNINNKTYYADVNGVIEVTDLSDTMTITKAPTFSPNLYGIILI